MYLRNLDVSAYEVTQLCSAVANIVDYCEIGHGLGLGGHRVFGSARETDREYARVASEALVGSSTKWGLFSIAGITTEQDLQEINPFSPDFIRIGMDNPNSVDNAILLTEHCQNIPEKFWFFMKSYSWTYDELRSATEKGKQLGVNVYYIVDSAGCMLPTDVSNQVKLLKDTGVQVGFHGHDNLGMAMANSMAAVDSGASIVDGAMLGTGRSGGNCLLEGLLRVYRVKEGVSENLTNLNMITRGLENIYPNSKFASSEVLYGLTGFHSGFERILLEVANNRGVDFFKLVSAHSKITYHKPTEKTIEQAISLINKEKE